MVQRSKRSGVKDKGAVLQGLSNSVRACQAVLTEEPINSEAYMQAGNTLLAVYALADLVAGEKDVLLAPLHSAN